MIYEVDTFMRIHSKRLSKQQIVSPKFQFVQKNPRRGLQGHKVENNYECEVKMIKKFPREKITYHDYYEASQPEPKDNRKLLKIFDYLQAVGQVQNRYLPTAQEEDEAQNEYECLSSTNFKYKRAQSAVRCRDHQTRKSFKIQKVQINPFPQDRQDATKGFRTPSRPLTAKTLHKDQSRSISLSRSSSNPLSANITRFLRKIANAHAKKANSKHQRGASATVTPKTEGTQTYQPPCSQTLKEVDCNGIKKHTRKRVFQLMKFPDSQHS